MQSTCPETLGPETTSTVQQIRNVDRDLLICLRTGGSRSVGELQAELGVTATAVRQRIDRMIECGLVTREKESVGRGRPIFRYGLTSSGRRRVGADAALLAEAMWQEILAIGDETIRDHLVSAVAKRMGRDLGVAIDAIETRDSVEMVRWKHRLTQLADLLHLQDIPASVNVSGGLPVLDMEACPFPGMTDAAGERSMCRLEEQMFSEALGKPVHLSSCRLDGDACCRFSLADPTAGSTPEKF